jgi:hypothetical protein
MVQRNKHAFVGARILEQDDLPLLEVKTSLLCQEQIGAFNDVFEMRFAVSVDKSRHIRDVDSLGSTSTRYEKVRLEPEMRAIPEISAVEDDFARYPQ